MGSSGENINQGKYHEIKSLKWENADRGISLNAPNPFIPRIIQNKILKRSEQKSDKK